MASKNAKQTKHTTCECKVATSWLLLQCFKYEVAT